MMNPVRWTIGYRSVLDVLLVTRLMLIQINIGKFLMVACYTLCYGTGSASTREQNKKAST